MLMRKLVLALSMAAFATAAQAEMAAPTPAPAPPPQYGQPGVNLEQATKAVEAAAAEAKKNGWFMAIAVVSNGGHLVHFSKMDQTQFASVQIAMHKAKAAAMFRRPTKVFEDRVAAGGAGLAVLSLDGVIASDGGIPLMRDGRAGRTSLQGRGRHDQIVARADRQGRGQAPRPSSFRSNISRGRSRSAASSCGRSG
jgi:glc operon protein GlcG